MGVIDGQPVNQAITNPAFINKNVDDVMPNKLGFNRPLSGPTIADIQQAVNNIYTATGVSESQSGTTYNATPGTITNGDSYQLALTKLADKFDPATGHFHTGSAGDGPLLHVVRTLVASGGSPIFGDLTLIAGTNMAITESATGFTFDATTSVTTTIAASGNPDLSGQVILVAGGGVTLSQVGQDITISASGGGGGSSSPPTVQTFLSGSGTYTRPTTPSPSYIKVTMVGAGGGGAGSSVVSSNDGGFGTSGGNTTFGTSLLTANGGAFGPNGAGAGNGGAGGTASVTTSATVLQLEAISGAYGQGGNYTTAANVFLMGGNGGSSPLGGGGAGAGAGGGGSPVAGTDGSINSGSGGGGASAPSLGEAGTGGGAGGYVQAIITSPSATYSYSVGSLGSAGAAGTGGAAGGAGGSGIIIVEEYY